MRLVTHEKTVHFDDRPCGVRAHGYFLNGSRFNIFIGEDIIFSKLNVRTLTPEELVEWVREHKTEIEKFCDDHLTIWASRLGLNGQLRGPLPDGSLINFRG